MDPPDPRVGIVFDRRPTGNRLVACRGVAMTRLHNFLRGPRTTIVAGVCAAGIVTLGAILAPPAPIAAGGKSGGGKKSVACFESSIPGGKKPDFEPRPKRCVFIAAGAIDSPIPPSFAVQQIMKIDWKKWGGNRAEGRGKGYTTVRPQPVPVTVTLSKPRKKCGHRAYTKAKFKYQFGIPAEPLNLSPC